MLLAMPPGYFSISMYKNRVEKDRICFEIPAFLPYEWGNSAENEVGKFKICILCMDIVILNSGNFKKGRVCHFLYPIFYIIPLSIT